jgi:hypothetical protein
MDSIGELPDTHGHDVIMNVVDSVGKWAHFIPTTTTITALRAAQLFLQNVWKVHGLPRSVVSDCGPQFVVEFTQELYRLLGITLLTTTAYHPQADGQTEQVNQELEQYLRVFINEWQDDWDELLPTARVEHGCTVGLIFPHRTHAWCIPIPNRKYHGILQNPRYQFYPWYINDNLS